MSLIIGDRRDQVNYEKNGSRKEHKEKQHAPEPKRPLTPEQAGVFAAFASIIRADNDEWEKDMQRKGVFGEFEKPADKET
jgi:hypothetical protein